MKRFSYYSQLVFQVQVEGDRSCPAASSVCIRSTCISSLNSFSLSWTQDEDINLTHSCTARSAATIRPCVSRDSPLSQPPISNSTAFIIASTQNVLLPRRCRQAVAKPADAEASTRSGLRGSEFAASACEEDLAVSRTIHRNTLRHSLRVYKLVLT